MVTKLEIFFLKISLVIQLGIEEKMQNLFKICVDFFENKNFKVICSIQSIFPDMQKENRSIFKNYLQIYTKVPTKILMRRNNKKIYSKKNVVNPF